MYQVINESATIKFKTAEEKAVFNTIAEKLQTIENKPFSNALQVFLSLVNYCGQLETELETLKNNPIPIETIPETPDTVLETIETTEIDPETITEPSENKQKIITLIGETLEMEYNPTDEELFADIYEIITEPKDEETEIQAAPIEVERKLSENEFLLSLKPTQTEVLKTIARWRFMTRKDDHTNNIPELIIRMLFNKGVLLNWHGQFETGITEKHIKQ